LARAWFCGRVWVGTWRQTASGFAQVVSVCVRNRTSAGGDTRGLLETSSAVRVPASELKLDGRRASLLVDTSSSESGSSASSAGKIDSWLRPSRRTRSVRQCSNPATSAILLLVATCVCHKERSMAGRVRDAGQREESLQVGGAGESGSVWMAFMSAVGCTTGRRRVLRHDLAPHWSHPPCLSSCHARTRRRTKDTRLGSPERSGSAVSWLLLMSNSTRHCRPVRSGAVQKRLRLRMGMNGISRRVRNEILRSKVN